MTNEAALAVVLAEQRDHVRALVEAAAALPPAGPGTDRWEAEQRRLAVRRLRRYVIPRAGGVGRHVLPLARRHLTDGASLVREYLAVKRHAEEAVAEMSWYDERNADQNDLLARAADCLGKCFLLEEQMMAGLGGRLSPSDDTGAAAGMRRAVTTRWSSTRPHPDLPATPLWSRLITPVVAVVDRLNDRLSPPTHEGDGARRTE